jgi:3-oxoacyl-[acyl-carrier protein] reductase
MVLKGKKAIVTGGDRGIGKAISLSLAEKGAHIAVHYHKNEQRAEKTVRRLEEFGVSSLKVRADVASFVQVKKIVEETKKNLGGIDILVNNAGLSGPNSTLEKIDTEEWREVIEVNLTGVFYCCKAAEQELRKNNGKIVNISSIAGKMGGLIGCHYAASKAGVIGLTFALARELAPQVTVNAVAPGPVDTEFLSPELKKKLAAQVPFGRMANPEEIAHTVVYLLENDYVSGEVVDVNAGRYMD